MSITVLHPDAYIGELAPPLELGGDFTHLALLSVNDAAGPIRAYVKIFPKVYADGSASKGLVNELVGYFCARRAGLPTPNLAGLAILDPSRISRTPQWLDRGAFVVAWWSEDVGAKSLRATLNIDALPKGSVAYDQALSDARQFLMECSEVYALVAFDDLIANVDRNLGNILANRRAITLIDHGQTLSGPAWRAEHLVPNAVYQNKVRSLLGPAFEALPFKSSVMARYAAISESVQTALPDLRLWLERLLVPADAQTALDFLKLRSDIGLAARRIGVIA